MPRHPTDRTDLRSAQGAPISSDEAPALAGRPAELRGGSVTALPLDPDAEAFQQSLARSRWGGARDRTAPATSFAPRTSEQRLRDNARDRTVVAFVRTSTYEQGDRDRRGSPSAQLASAHEEAERLGVELAPDNVIEAFGEAGTRRVHRRQFLLLRARVRSGHIGVVIVPEHHRLSRNVTDAEAFFTECADARVLLLVNGQPFDPNVPTDRYMLGMMAQFAQYENESRIRWMMKGRLQRARELRARYPLPAGLVWVSPANAAYVRAARHAGLDHYLARIPEHRAFSPAKDQTYYILPFPQADVEAACRLRVQWLLEPGGSLKEVYERIRAGGGGWPYKGLVPKARRGSRYRDGMTWSRTDWEPVSLSRLASYLESPSLYGIYSWYSPTLAENRAPRPVRERGSHGDSHPTVRSRTFPPLPTAADLLTLRALPASPTVLSEPPASTHAPTCDGDDRPTLGPATTGETP